MSKQNQTVNTQNTQNEKENKVEKQTQTWHECHIRMVGFITTEPELAYTADGNPFLRFGIVNKRRKDSLYFVTVWGKRAEALAETPKNALVGIEGYIENGMNEEEGRLYQTQVIVPEGTYGKMKVLWRPNQETNVSDRVHNMDEDNADDDIQA